MPDMWFANRGQIIQTVFAGISVMLAGYKVWPDIKNSKFLSLLRSPRAILFVLLIAIIAMEFVLPSLLIKYAFYIPVVVVVLAIVLLSRDAHNTAGRIEQIPDRQRPVDLIIKSASYGSAVSGQLRYDVTLAVYRFVKNNALDLIVSPILFPEGYPGALRALASSSIGTKEPCCWR